MDRRMIIQSSLDYIEKNLKAEISAAELANQAGYSLFHYCRMFLSVVGMPVMQYILRRRLLHCIYEIHSGEKRIDTILSYGFETYAGFYKAFQREFCCTPSIYLQNNRVKPPYRVDLAQEGHMIVTHKKASKLLCYWNLEKEPITDIYYENTGVRNDNAYYVGRDFVLKFTPNFKELENHIEVSHSIESVGLLSAIPVPTIDGSEYIQEDGMYFYLTKRIPGNQLMSINFYSGENFENARLVGEIIGQLHIVLSQTDACIQDSNLLETVTVWALPRAKEILELDEDFCRNYLSTFQELYSQLPRQIIHRDPNPGNIICSDTHWGFIDFDLSEQNIRIYDPCYAATAILSETFGQNDAKWLEIYRNIIYGYDSAVHITREEQIAIPYVILANQFVCVASFSEREKDSELFCKNKQMTSWLIDQFEKLKEI